MQLTQSLWGAWLILLLSPYVAQAEGEITSSGGYYKERSTRVIQPMIDLSADVGEQGRVATHVLIDSITSASVGAGATTGGFTERRYETGARYTHTVDEWKFGVQGRFSSEPDYLSLFASAFAEKDFAQRNTSLRLGLTGGKDTINNSGGSASPMSLRHESLRTWLVTSSLSQILSKTTVVSLSFDLAHLKGYQANMYRTVFAGGVAEGERVPQRRIRQATSLGMKQYILPTNTTAQFGYRFFSDSWGVVGHTADLVIVQNLTDHMDLFLKFRSYFQTAADFYKNIYATSDREREPFLTDDPKLSKMNTQTVGSKIDVTFSQFGCHGRLKNVRIALNFDTIWQSTRFGRAFSSQLSLTLPF